jgi:drug/metabolite transporter (DMT)-like permease
MRNLDQAFATPEPKSSAVPMRQVWLALLIVYVVWGSTYLAIRYGVEVAPPYLFASIRFAVASAVMLVWAKARGLAFPNTAHEWKVIAVTGALLLAGANGLVTWSEQWVASGQAALMVATSALWMAWFGTLGSRGERLAGWTWIGLVLGFVGVAVLVGDGLSTRAGPIGAYIALMISPMLWAGGSIYSRRNPVSSSPAVTAALQMGIASILMAGIGVASGEPARWAWNAQAWWAMAYLAVFGSIIGYMAYFWLVHHTTPALLGTYAYVNPAVAVALGCWLAGEPFSLTHALGTAVILLGVVVVSVSAHRRRLKLG